MIEAGGVHVPRRGAVTAVGGLLTAHPVRLVFAAALAVRFLAVPLVALRFGAEGIAVDDDTYSQLAADVAAGETGQWSAYQRNLFERAGTFLIPLSLLYEVVGHRPLAGAAAVALVGALGAALVVRLAGEVLEPVWAGAAGLVVALLPSQIAWSSTTLKDPFVWTVVVALGLAAATAARSTGARLALALAALPALVFLLGHLRLHAAVLAAWALVATAWWGRRGTRWWRLAAALAIAVVLPVTLGAGPGGMGLALRTVGGLELVRAANASEADSSFRDGSLLRARIVQAVETDELGVLAALDAHALDDQQLELLATVLRDLSALVAEEQDQPLSEQLASSADAVAGGNQRAAAASIRAIVTVARGSTRGTPREGDGAAPAAEAGSGATVVQVAVAQATERGGRGDRPLPEPVGPPPAPRPPLELARDLLARQVPALVEGLPVVLAAPYPWTRPSSGTVRLAQLESLVWYPLLLLALVGVTDGIRRLRPWAFTIAVGAGTLVVHALTQGNVGTAFRHRGELVALVALLAAAGARRLVASRRAR